MYSRIQDKVSSVMFIELVFALPEEIELCRQREWPSDITKGVHILWERQLTSELKNSLLLNSFRSELLKGTSVEIHFLL